MMLRKESYQDLDLWRETKRKQKRRYRSRTGSNKYLPHQWSDSEDQQVLRHERPDRELAKQIGHSVQAIQVRRCRLRKVGGDLNE